MEINNKITIDMSRRGVSPVVDAMQFDTNTRVVSVSMLANGVPWVPPNDSVFSLSYQKPDGTKGFYNRLSDDEVAVSVRDNVVTVVLAHQVLTVPGVVNASLVAYSGSLRIAAFPFEIHVTPDPSAGETNSDDYFNPGTGSGLRKLKNWEIVESGSVVTLNYTLEGEDKHTDVITFDANGYPISINHDGFVANGTWEVSNG